MSNIAIYKTAFSSIRQNGKLIFFLYAITFVLAFLVARPLYSTLIEEANGSIEPDRLFREFDYMTFSDFVRLHGNALKPFVSLSLLIALLHLVLSNLFLGGIFVRFTVPNEKFSMGDFLKNGVPTFGKYLLVLIFEVLLIICIIFASGMFFFIFALIAEGGNERDFILWLIPPFLLLFISFLIAFLTTDFAKIYLFLNPKKNAWQGFMAGIGYVLGRLKTLQFYWAAALLTLLVMITYLAIEASIGMVSVFTMYVMFFVQQLVVLARTAIKVGYWASIFSYYEAHPIIQKVVFTPSDDESPEGGDS